MVTERLQLVGLDRARYFLPTAICLYLSILCLVLIVASIFLVNLQDAVAVTVAGAFGLLLTGGLGYLFWRAQRRDLLYAQVATASDAAGNFAAVRAAAALSGWRILREEPARCLEARTRATLLDVGERISVQFRDRDVLIACICDPGVGFSLAGRRHCLEHREVLRRAVAAREP